MSKPFYAVIDLETTGCDNLYNEIVDICVIAIDREFNEVSRYETKVLAKHLENMTEESQGIMGYNEDIWIQDGAISQKALSIDLHEYLEELCDGYNLAPVGHGIHHDLGFLLMLGSQKTYPMKFINSLMSIDLITLEKVYDIIYDEIKQYPPSLQTLCNQYGVQLDRHNGIHTATSDAEATLEVFRKQVEAICSI